MGGRKNRGMCNFEIRYSHTGNVTHALFIPNTRFFDQEAKRSLFFSQSSFVLIDLVVSFVSQRCRTTIEVLTGEATTVGGVVEAMEATATATTAMAVGTDTVAEIVMAVKVDTESKSRFYWIIIIVIIYLYLCRKLGTFVCRILCILNV